MKPFKDHVGRKLYEETKLGLSQDDGLSPIKLKLKNKIKYEDIGNIHDFIKHPLPRNKVLKASIKKEGNCMLPRSDLYLTEELRYLMSSKKKFCSCGSIFHFTS